MWFLVMEEEEEETTPRRAHLHRMRAWCVMYWSAEPGEDKEARQAEREQGSDENRRCLEREREKDERGPPLCRADCPFMHYGGKKTFLRGGEAGRVTHFLVDHFLLAPSTVGLRTQ